MQEVTAKRKLRASEGAHLFYVVILLVGAVLIPAKGIDTTCGVNLALILDLIICGLGFWLTYQLITLIPRYKNPAMKIFFSFVDLLFGLYTFCVFVYGNTLWYDENNDCRTEAPVLAYYI